MNDALAYSAIGLAAVSALFLCLLVVRRLLLRRESHRRALVETRLRPLALAVADGEVIDLPHLGDREAVIFAELLARFATKVSGDSRTRIATFFEQEGAVERELVELRSRLTWRRATAAFVLGDMGSPAAIPALSENLGDRSREVRAAAVRSLGRLGALEVVPQLVQLLVEGRVPRAVVGRALLEIGAPAAPALEALLNHPEADVRAGAAELIGLTGDAAHNEALIRALRDPAAEVRAKAARALGRLGAEEGAAELRATLSDRITFVRVAAARALGLIRDRDAVPPLLNLARQDSFDAARAAAWAVSETDPRALAAAAAGRDPGPHVLEAADLTLL